MAFKVKYIPRYRAVLTACKWIVGVLLASVAIATLPLCYLGYLATLTAALVASVAAVLAVAIFAGLSFLQAKMNRSVASMQTDDTESPQDIKSLIREIKKHIRSFKTKASLDEFVQSWRKEATCELKLKLLAAIKASNSSEEAILDELNSIVKESYRWCETNEMVEALKTKKTSPITIIRLDQSARSTGSPVLNELSVDTTGVDAMQDPKHTLSSAPF